MDRNYPGTGFGDLGAGAGWSYERSAKASLVYGSSRSSHPESELLHRQAYATPHPLQGYATNHHPGSLSGLFDTGLHHASPSAPDASVMNLISALESRGPQPPPSASSLLSQFRTPSWQTAMHTPAPPELFISGALPGSGSFPSSSALSAYQHPASFSSRSFPTASLSLQDTPTFSPTSNGLLSPHDPLIHIKAPSQSSLGFDRLLSSQGAAAAAYRGSQDPTGATSAQASSARHLQSHQFNLLSSQLQDQSSQLYNPSVFSSAQPQPQSQSQSNSAQERAVPRQDSVIKHYQRPTPAQSQLSSSAAHSLQHYLSCGGAGYQQIATHHRHAGLSCSPLGDQSPSSDHKPTSRTEQYRPIIQPPYSSSSSSSSSSSAGKGTKSSSSSGYSSGSSASSSRTPHTPPSASSTSSSSSSSSQAPATSTSAPQSLPKSCLSGYGSPVPPVKTPTSALTGQTPPQQQTQSYSPNQPPPSHLAQSYGGFSSPQAQDLSSGTGGKGYGSLGGRSQSYSTDIYGADSAYGSLPSSLGGAGSPSLGYGAPGHSPALLRSSGSSGSGASGGGSSSGAGSNSGIIRPGLHSPVPTCPTQSPGGAGSNKYISSVLSPTFLASPQGFPDTRGPSSQPQSYHSTSSKTKADTSMLGVGSQRSQEEVDDDDEFLIQHLLQAQASPAPQAAHHHPQQQPQQTSQQTQPQPQSVPPTTDSGKGMSYDMGKTSEERYHPQSVIRTHSATSTAGVGNAGSGGSISGLDNQLEMSLKKQQQHQQHHHQHQHSLAPQHSSHSQHVSSHSQIPSHTQMELQKKSQERTHSHHPHTQPHPQQQPPHPHHIPPPSASAHSQPQPDPQQPLSAQLTPQQSQLDQQRSEQHQFDTVSPVEKADQNQQSNRFVPLTSICFPDSLLQDEDRSFFPGMEDMFCAEDYKSSCAGGAGPGQDEMNESHGGQEGMDSMKAGQSAGGAGGSSGASYDIMGHHGADQGYEPYCHGLEEPSNNTMTLDLDSLKTHELPSTVNTEQLGLIQSQAPAMGMGSNTAGPNNAGAKMASGPGGTSTGTGSGGLQSPIFCSSRPKKLLKSSSFHLLKERRDPNTLPKKSYAQEYDFEDDEDKADQPADIRLNSRRLPDLLPDLVSSCRKGGGGGGSLSPLMGDIDFYHSSGYSSMGSHSLLPPEGPKKRGRKPTRPKREGPPRPRGRPRIRPMPEPYTPRGMMGEMGGTTVGGGFSVEGRGRGRGRGSRGRGGRREDMYIEMNSLSGTDPALSDGSVGSAPSLGLSPGPPCSTESSRSQDKNKQKSQMMSEGKDSESKAGFVASFLDFLKTGKRPPGLDISPGMEPDNGDSSPCKSGGLRPLSPAPPPPPPPPPFGDGEGNGGLALGNCPSPKRLEDELKRNLETLPSFSSDEEDSVGKNQDLQKSISSAISALYDTPQLTSNIQPPLSPPPPQPQTQPTQAPLTPTLQPPTLSPQPAMHTPLAQPQSNEPDVLQKESPMPSPESPASPEEPPAPKITSLHLAQKQEDAAIVGESEEDESESGGEGIFRERDEFVVRVEDIRTLKLALQTGREPPPIWRVQKALLQKFSPEIKDGQRQFCATSNYLGYFGDAKRRYQRIYVKFLENVNKKDYVRVCSRRPWRRATPALRRQSLPRMASPPATQPPPRATEKEDRVTPPVQREQRERTRTATTATTKEQREKKEAPAAVPKAKERERDAEKEREKRVQPQQEKVEKRGGAAERGRAKEDKKALERKEKEKAERPPKSKPAKVKAEPPPKKRKKWLKEVPSSSDSDSSDEAASENESEMPVKGGVNNRAMREMFRSYVEMLVSTALDPDMIQALEDTDDELYLPPMRKIDSILSEQKRRLLRRVSMSSQHQEVLHAYPQIIVDPLDTGVVRIRLSGDAYNRKTLNRVKKTLPKPQDLKLSADSYRIYSLYHSLHHYKYHTFLQCKKETNTIEQAAEDPGQEEVVQQCMANQSWLDTLFGSFIELLTLSTKA
uniref:Proline rich 12a n=1 Tax=Acanthochromis polyacanthus TaxID=80966 RepID=A0A3Q1GMX4_9TELE